MTPDEVRSGIARLTVAERIGLEEAVGLALAVQFADELRREQPEVFQAADTEADRLVCEGQLETPEGKVRLQEALLALARAAKA